MDIYSEKCRSSRKDGKKHWHTQRYIRLTNTVSSNTYIICQISASIHSFSTQHFIYTVFNDNNNKKLRYSLQTEVITTLSTKINTQLSTLESRLSTLPRSEAAPLRSTHVKLSRDYRLVEQRYKNLVLDVKKRRNLRQVRKREDEKMTDTGGGNGDGGSFDVRRQMQIQEDVSGVRRLTCMHRLNNSFTHFLFLSLSLMHHCRELMKKS